MEAKSLQYALMSRPDQRGLASLRGFMSVEIVTDTGTPISKLPYSIMNESLFARIEGANEKFAFWVGRYPVGRSLPRSVAEPAGPDRGCWPPAASWTMRM